MNINELNRIKMVNIEEACRRRARNGNVQGNP